MAGSDEARFMTGPFGVKLVKNQPCKEIGRERVGTVIGGLNASELLALALLLIAVGAVSGFLACIF